MRKIIGGSLIGLGIFLILGTAGSCDLDTITLTQAGIQLLGAGLTALIGWLLFSKSI